MVILAHVIVAVALFLLLSLVVSNSHDVDFVVGIATMATVIAALVAVFGLAAMLLWAVTTIIAYWF